MHVGQLIKDELQRQPKSHTIVWFAQQLNCNRRNVYDIFARQYIDTHLLARISAILDHDFFADLSRMLHEEDTM